MKINKWLGILTVAFLVTACGHNRHTERVTEYYNQKQVKSKKREVTGRKSIKKDELALSKIRYTDYHPGGKKKSIHRAKEKRRVYSPAEYPWRKDVVRNYDEKGKRVNKVVRGPDGRRVEYIYNDRGKLMSRRTIKDGRLVKLKEKTDHNRKVQEGGMASMEKKKNKKAPY